MMSDTFDKELADGIKRVNIAHSIEAVTRLDLATCIVCLPEDTLDAKTLYLLLEDGQMQHPLVQTFMKKVSELR